jgi:large subunit ribosomal protein L13e
MHHIKATITKQNGKQSTGKGFSPNELKAAGVSKQQARQIGLPIDEKRKSSHDENVATIKSHAQKAKAQAKPKTAKPKAEPDDKS